MKLRFILALFAATFFICRGTFAEDVSAEDLKAQIERMEQMLEAQQTQISELKRVLEEKIGIASPSARNDKEKEVEEAVKDEKIEYVVEKYLEKPETKEKFAKLGILPNLNMGYKDGFYLETLDKKFKLQMEGRLQTRYEFLDRDEGKEDTSSFSLRRARLAWKGHTFSPNINYKLEAAFDKGQDFQLLDYYFNMTHLPALNIQFGQFKAPFNRQRITSAGNLQLIDRSEANEVFNLDRQIGIMLHSEQLLDKKFEYGFGLFNGSSVTGRHASSGRNLSENDNNKHLFVLRAAYNPFGEFGYSEGDLEHSEKLKATIGGAGAFSSDKINILDGTGKTIGAEDVDTARLVGEFGLKYRGASLLSEVFYRHRDASQISKGSPLERNSIVDTGFFTQAGYFIIPKRLELAGRFSLVDYDNVSFNNLNMVREYTGGLNYFFNGHRNKLQANVVKTEDDVRNAKDEDTYKFQLQYQIYF